MKTFFIRTVILLYLIIISPLIIIYWLGRFFNSFMWKFPEYIKDKYDF